MSLADVAVIDGIKIDVTPDGGSTVSRSYIASNVQVGIKWEGQQWTYSNGQNNLNTQFQWLVFTISGDWIDQVSNTGNLRAPALIVEDLKDSSGYTVELYPDKDQSKKFEVIAWNPGDGGPLAAFENGARSDSGQIQCITRDKVNRSDIEWFRKYG